MTRYERIYHQLKRMEGTKSFKLCGGNYGTCACTGCANQYGVDLRLFNMYKSGELRKFLLDRNLITDDQ